MKKILKNKSLILLLLCIFALVGCGKNRDKKDGTTEAKETTDADTEEEYKSWYEVYGANRGISNIDELGEDYSVDDAINDGCFVIGAAKVYNDNLYEEFMKKYEDKEEAYIRVVQSTTEGDAIIYDIFYIPESKEWMDAVYPDRVDVVIDSTRDKFAAEDERMIFMEKFDGVAEYESNSSIYWVAYRGNPEDIDLAGKDTFVIRCK